MNILVAGANGFVGTSLLPRLIEEGHQVTGLARTHMSHKKHEKAKWIEGNLLNPSSLPKLKKVDAVFYLVHGLKGETGSFEHDEAMASVNFINWMRQNKLSPRIIYLGGLGEEHTVLSPHLRSRHLTGSILGSSGMPLTEFRASIILGEGSLSFEMIKAIVERIPFRPEMSILGQACQPLALADLLNYLVAALKLETPGHTIIEIGGPDQSTYGELIDLYAELAGIKRKVIKLPEVEPKVLMKALDYALPEHANIGRKLTESLTHPTVVTNNSAKETFPNIEPQTLRVAMDIAQSTSKTHYAPLWEKDFLKMLLSDKLLTQSGLLSPDLLRNLEKVGKLRDIFSRK